ncbi:MAG: hypothetical protein AABW84_00065 [Nanoarchaeota archaeon]
MTIQISRHKDNDKYKIFNADDMTARGKALINGYEVIKEFTPIEEVKLPADISRNDLIALLELHKTNYVSRLEIAKKINGSITSIAADKFALKGIDDILEDLYETSTE